MERFNDIGAAVIGSGFIGTVHIENLRRLGVGVRGVLGSDPERGVAAAARVGLPRAYTSLDELLDDAAVQAVHVTSPNQLHYPQVKQILAAGRHVICEKPLAVTSAESAELVELAAASDRITAVNFNIRFYPLNQHAQQMVRDGDLGEPRLITGHYFQDWLLLDTDWNWRLEPEKGGELRAVGDIGSLTGSTSPTFITGPRSQSVMADLSTFVKVRQRPSRTGRDVQPGTRQRHHPNGDDHGGRGPDPVALRQRSARLGRGQPGERGPQELAAVGGRRLDIRSLVGLRDARPSLHRPSQPARRDPAAQRRGHERVRDAGGSLPGGHVEGFGDTFHALFRETTRPSPRASAPDRPLYATFEDGHHEMAVGDAVARSAREGKWVDVAA